MAEPLVVFGAPMIPEAGRLAALMGEALAAGWLTNGGALHLRLEQALTAHEATGDAVSLVSSGTMALMLALGLGHLPPGAEVITTPLSFAATAQAIAWCGLPPGLCRCGTGQPDALPPRRRGSNHATHRSPAAGAFSRSALRRAGPGRSGTSSGALAGL